MNYTNEAMMTAALNLQSDCTLVSNVESGTNVLQVPTGIFYRGQTLAIDYYAPDIREVATVLGYDGVNITLASNLTNSHSLGTPIKEVTSMTDVVPAASRIWDDLTFYRNTFDLTTVTETLKGYIDTDGLLYVAVTKPIIQSVSALSFIVLPGDTPTIVGLTAIDFDGYTIRGNVGFPQQKITATVTYSGGFDPIPADIQRATTVLACRLWKEKDSGFSDVIGNSELGILQYKKGIPSGIEAVVKHYKRWVP